MNRLAGMRCYLCGAMERVNDCGVTWRKNLREDLSYLGIIWLDPTNKPSEKAVEGEKEIARVRQLAKYGYYDELARMARTIRHVDLRLVDICDFMIVYLDLNVHACGTYEELFWANRMKKPVLVIVKQGKAKAPGWLFGTLPHQMIFSARPPLYDYLDYIDHDPNINTLGRWEFFDLED